MGCWTPPFGNPQVSLRYPDWPNSSPLRGWSFGAVGEGRERVRARLGCRTSTASGWGLTPPGPPRSPLGNVRRSCAPVGGFAPLPPRFGRRFLVPRVPCQEKSADHARTRMGPRPKWLCGQRLRKSPGSSCREAARSSVTSLARLWPKATLARPQRGNPKGGAALFGQSLPTFCWSESRGPARPERVEGVI